MKIKTRESLRTIKTFDRAESLAGKTKGGLSEANRQAEDVQRSDSASATDYAGNQVQGSEERIARTVVYGADKIGRWGVRETRKNIWKWKNRPKKLKVPKPKQIPTPQRAALPAGKKMVKTAHNTAKTTQKPAKTAKTTAKASAKAAKAAAKAAKMAAQATVKFIKVAAKAIVATVKATVAAVKGIVAAIAAGGWVAVVIILVIVVVGGLVAGVCDIFTPNDEGGYSVAYLMSVCENEAIISEKETIANTPHDYLVIEGQEASKKDVIAVFAVLTKSFQKDFSKLDSELQDEFRAVFNVMNTMDSYTSTSEETVIHEYTDKGGNPYQVKETVTKTTLHIQYNSMTASDGAYIYHFDEKQREQLNTLLSADFNEMWIGILDD